MKGRDTKLRIRVNTSSLVKIAGIVSNSVMLAANAYLIGSGIHNSIRIRKQERVQDNLQTTAELASAIAGLTKVISETIGVRHEQSSEVL